MIDLNIGIYIHWYLHTLRRNENDERFALH
jgi:hypothetical protein